MIVSWFIILNVLVFSCISKAELKHEEDMEEKMKSYLKSMKDHHVMLKQGLHFLHHPIKGWGMFATEKIENGTILAAIPRSAAVSLPLLLDSSIHRHTSRLLKKLKETFVPDRILLALGLVLELRNENSEFSHWFSLFPPNSASSAYSSSFSLLMAWNAEDQALLKGTSIEGKGEKDISGLLSDYFHLSSSLELVIPEIFGTNQETVFHGIHAGPLTFEEWRWAWSVIWTRGCDIQLCPKEISSLHTEDPETTAIIPLIDMINHENLDYINAKATEDGCNGFSLVAVRSIEQDEEVLVSYGSFANRDLIKNHGFAVVNNPIQSISLKILWGEESDAVWRNTGRKLLLRRLGFPSKEDIEGNIWRNEQGTVLFEERIIRVLEIVLANEDELSSSMSLATKKNAYEYFIKIIKKKLEIIKSNKDKVILRLENIKGGTMETLNEMERNIAFARASAALILLQEEFSLMRDAIAAVREDSKMVQNKKSKGKQEYQWRDPEAPHVIQGVVEVPVKCSEIIH